MKSLYIYFILFHLITINVVAQVSFLDYEYIYSSNVNHLSIINDFDNDSLNDLVLASQYYFDSINDYKLIIYKQENNELVFQYKIPYPDVYPGLTSMTSGDIDNDSLNDIIVGYSDSIIIFYQIENGFFDENNYTKFYSGHNVYGLACKDLNNDKLDDIAVSHWHEDSLKIYYQTNDGSFIKKSYYKKISVANDLIIEDINNDNLNDVILSNGWQISQQNPEANKYSFAVYLQNIDSTLNDHLLFKIEDGLGNHLEGIDIGDLNNDGLPDIAGARYSELYIWYQNSTNKDMFNNYPPSINAYTNCGPLKIADLNNNDKNEIMIGHDGWHNVSVWESDQNYNFYNYNYLFHSITESTMSIGDLNNDNQIDIATAFWGGVAIIYNNSSSISIHKVNDENNVKIFPNPISGERFFIEYKDYKDINWILRDVYGKILKKGKMNSKIQEVKFSNHFTSGVYILELCINNQIINTNKLIK